MLINDNIKIIKESTLIVGIDVAKNVHYASASDSRGIQIGKTISFNNDVEGINNLLKWINSLKLKFNKSDTIIGLEPTGHYWFNLHDFIADNFINTQIVLVNPWDSKYMRKLNGNINKKTDSIDSIAIARSVKDGRFFRKSLHEGVFEELKDYMRLREKEIKSKTRVKNQITRWLDIAFPEFTKVFKDCFCNSALVLLEKYPTPKHVVEADVDDLLKTLRTKVSTSVGKKKLNQLKNAASKSIGKKVISEAMLLEFNILLEDYNKLCARIVHIESKAQNLVLSIPWASNVVDIKGIGVLSVAAIVSEIGDISKFDDGKQLQSLCGFDLRENSSGTHKGKTTISKKGNKRLRAYLFRVSLPLVKNNDAFKELHNYYTTRKDNPLKKKQSLIAVCCKLLRIMYGMAKTNSEFSPIEVTKTINQNRVYEAA